MIQRLQLFKTKLNKLRLVKIILALISLILIFFLTLPLVPELQYRLKTKSNNVNPNYPVSYSQEDSRKYVTDGNRLFISKIDVDSKILEGESEDVMNVEEGVWRDPLSTNPTSLGNMVIAGHRFQYLPPNTTTFYNLDKLENGDIIKVYWEGIEYIYVVSNIFEVDADEVWIKDQPKDSKQEITIYTCTPIYTSEKRLVVKAELKD